MPFRFFFVLCSERSVFSLVSFSLSTGIVVDIWFVGSGALPSRTTILGGGVGAGGVGVVPFVATVAEGEGVVAAGTPAEGFFAARLCGFGGAAGGGVVVVVVVVSVGAGCGAGAVSG